ncbi:MAG TPA: pilin [Rhodanobacteraceae bacterium]|nr:pilin [Rhodanobacteraceae bacterium]
MKSIQKGFTLIELMIVVAIIAILAAIAIPAYQNYVIRAQVSEGMTLSDGAKTAIAEYYTNHGSFPASNASAGLSDADEITGKYVTSVGTGSDGSGTGQIEATFGNQANSAISSGTLTLSAVTNGGSISWTCKGDGSKVVDKYLPSSCRSN